MLDEKEIESLIPQDAKTALGVLLSGQPLRGVNITGTVDLNQLSLKNPHFAAVDTPIRIHRCRIDTIDCMATFNAPVEIKDCHFTSVQFLSSFFTNGLTISGCRIQEHFDFMWGGHNRNYPILIENCAIEAFANFEDCWFMGPVIFRNVQFLKGSNLLGLDGHPYAVKFDVPPEFENVQGDLGMPRNGRSLTKPPS